MLSSEELIYLRDQIRQARAAVVEDAEAFTEALFAIERLGSFLCRSVGALGAFQGEINRLASQSPLAIHVSNAHPELHVPFPRLYEAVRQARNDALHQGAYARHLTSRVIELAIVLEDALMTSLATVSEFMVRNPVSAALWQPLSFVRQQMLANSFSFMPVRSRGGVWSLVSDAELARYLRANSGLRKQRLTESLDSATSAGDIPLSPAQTIGPGELVEAAAAKLGQYPLLVTADSGQGELVGIITAFDLL